MDTAPNGTELTGGCACGDLRYTLARAPMFVNCCHCTQCQKLTGSAFVVNAIIENDNIHIEHGETIITNGPSESGKPHEIYRCAKCMSAVWTDYGRRPNYRFVRVSTLDDPDRFRPDAHIFVRSKLDWILIPEDQKSFDVFYVTEQEWTQEALARREAALKPV
jgi:hypothetical protein